MQFYVIKMLTLILILINLKKNEFTYFNSNIALFARYKLHLFFILLIRF